MPRNARNCINTTFFHIMVQGLNKEYIFNQNDDKAQYLKLINIIRVEFRVDIIAYCIMDNHVHILVQTDTIEQLSKFMHKINTLYAKYYNNENNRVGYVFRDRYKSQEIYSEKQLRACVNYIHNNPIKAKICKFPYEYKYSSYNKYMQNIEIFERNIREATKNNQIISQRGEQEAIVEANMIFLEDQDEKEEEIQNAINEFLDLNKIDLEILKKNKKYLEDMIIILKNNYNISLRKIADYLNIGREVVRKIAVNYKK